MKNKRAYTKKKFVRFVAGDVDRFLNNRIYFCQKRHQKKTLKKLKYSL